MWHGPAPAGSAMTPGWFQAPVRVRVLLHGFPEKERAIDVPANATVADLLRALDLRRDLVVVFRADRPVPDTDDVHDGETLRVLRVVSGG